MGGGKIREQGVLVCLAGDALKPSMARLSPPSMAPETPARQINTPYSLPVSFASLGVKEQEQKNREVLLTSPFFRRGTEGVGF